MALSEFYHDPRRHRLASRLHRQSHGDAGYAQVVCGHTESLAWSSFKNPFLLPHIERDACDEGSSNPNRDCQWPVISIFSLQSRHGFSHLRRMWCTLGKRHGLGWHTNTWAGTKSPYLWVCRIFCFVFLWPFLSEIRAEYFHPTTLLHCPHGIQSCYVPEKPVS